MTGMSKHTGQMTQARTSYLWRELMWGYRFANIFEYDSENGTYITHMNKLDELEQIDTALCSASRLDEILQNVGNIFERDTLNSCSYVNQLAQNDCDDDDDDDDCGIHTVKIFFIL
jgi:Inward rectifier potassium channel C-terminal domain